MDDRTSTRGLTSRWPGLSRGAAVVLLSGLIGAACSSDPAPAGPTDTGVAIDTGAPGVDGGPGAPDGAPAGDAAPPAPDAVVGLDAEDPSGDAGVMADGSASEDAALADAEPGDAGTLAPDAASGDASTPADAGPPPTDAGALDAAPGPLDSGTLGPDAAVATDAGNRCTSSRDCLPGVEVCGDIRVANGSIETRCNAANPSPPAAPVGGSCTQGSQCGSSLCLDDFAGECSELCADAALDCPAGFSCSGYQYNPGPVWVYACSRSCEDNSACGAPSGGNPGNVCSPQVFQRGGAWSVERVCQLPAGPGGLGAACANGGDCQSGLCLTTSRTVGCLDNGGCMSGEVCECANGQAPPCAGGAMASCVSSLCSGVCNDDGDCAAPNQPLTECRTDILLGLPDGTTVQLASCGRN